MAVFCVIIITIMMIYSNINKNTSVEIIEVQSEVSEKIERIYEIDFTDEELSYLKEFQNKGVITIATRESQTVYFPQANGEIKGFHYHLAQSFADYINVELKMKIVEFSDYFKKNGIVPENVKFDTQIKYSPDLFKEVDLYCDNITILPWREKLMRFVKLIPIRVIIVTRENEEITDPLQLNGKKIVVQHNTTYEACFKILEETYDLEVDYLFVESSSEASNAVSKGWADVTAKDSNKAISEMMTYDNLEVGLPISELQYSAWVVQMDNELLASILEKYFEYAMESGILDRLWHDEYGISLREYSELLDIMKEYEK